MRKMRVPFFDNICLVQNAQWGAALLPQIVQKLSDGANFFPVQQKASLRLKKRSRAELRVPENSTPSQRQTWHRSRQGTEASEADSFQRNNERATRQSGQDLHKARIFPFVSFITKQESEGELLSRKVGCHADSVSRLPK